MNVKDLETLKTLIPAGYRLVPEKVSEAEKTNLFNRCVTSSHTTAQKDYERVLSCVRDTESIIDQLIDDARTLEVRKSLLQEIIPEVGTYWWNEQENLLVKVTGHCDFDWENMTLDNPGDPRILIAKCQPGSINIRGYVCSVTVKVWKESYVHVQISEGSLIAAKDHSMVKPDYYIK